MIVRATARATRDIERTAEWWRDNRDVGSEGFLAELQAFAGLVVASPEVGQRYTVDVDAQVITVHAVWGARRGRGPRL